MVSEKVMAHQFPEQVDEYVGHHIASTHSLLVGGRKKAFQELGLNYQQLMAARNMEHGLGPSFYAKIIRQNWLSELQRSHLKELYQLHRTYWNGVDKRRKDQSSPPIGHADITAFKRIVAARLPREMAKIQGRMFSVHSSAFARLCEIFIEDMRISGHGLEAMKNGLCIRKWIMELDDDSIEGSIALASALRFTLYAAYHIHDRRVFDRLLRELHNLAKRSNQVWIQSAYHQNVRRKQVSFLDFKDRDLKEVVSHSQETVRTILESLDQEIIAPTSWLAAPLLAQCSHIQSLVLVGQVDKNHIHRLEEGLKKFTELNSGIKSDALLIARLVLAEAHLNIDSFEYCSQHLDYVSAELQNEMAHRFDGIRAVLYRIKGDVTVRCLTERFSDFENNVDEAVAHYDLAGYYFARSGNIHIGVRLNLRKSLIQAIKARPNALWDKIVLNNDYRFTEPIW